MAMAHEARVFNSMEEADKTLSGGQIAARSLTLREKIIFPKKKNSESR